MESTEDMSLAEALAAFDIDTRDLPEDKEKVTEHITRIINNKLMQYHPDKNQRDQGRMSEFTEISRRLIIARTVIKKNINNISNPKYELSCCIPGCLVNEIKRFMKEQKYRDATVNIYRLMECDPLEVIGIEKLDAWVPQCQGDYA